MGVRFCFSTIPKILLIDFPKLSRETMKTVVYNRIDFSCTVISQCNTDDKYSM